MFDASKLKIPTKQTPRLDAIFAILLLCATLSTALCVYQATRWNGVQAVDFGNSSKLRTESIRSSTLANTEIIVDVDTYLAWVNAVSSGDEQAARFLEDRFRPEFIPAFETWKAEGNTSNPVPPGTPFSLPEYQLAAQQESILLEEAAAEAFEQGKDANQNGDLYIANTVLFAIVLFFCGVYMKWESPNVRTGMLIVTTAIFGFAVFLMVSLLLKVGFI
ncbi:MAG: hypothetical protein LUQ61_05195 [Methanoregulaceae archaeon]|nr:hypothetical protein [Methanoregulaceae archaeon]